MLAPGGMSATRELQQRLVDVAPIEPGQRVVLGVGVVVAALCAPGLVAHGEHRRAAGEEQRGEQVADVAPAAGVDAGVVGGAFDAVVPGVVGVGTVAVVLAVRPVVLVLEGDDVRQREAVMRSDEIDAARRRLGRLPENIARAGETGGEFGRRPGSPRQKRRTVSRKRSFHSPQPAGNAPRW